MIPFWRRKIFVHSFMIILADFFAFKGIVSPDWKGLQMVPLDRFEV
jgi:hypothetical protein